MANTKTVLSLMAGMVLVAASRAFAQAAEPSTDKFLVNVNFGGQLADRTLGVTVSKPIYEETATLTSTQDVNKGFLFDFGGGVRIWGDIFVGEVANNLVFRAKQKPNGSMPLAERADSDREFLASRDIWFRPVQFANAPDGCLYVIDMYRELIEGAAFLAPQVLKTVDPSAGFDKGRIWRIVPDGHKRREPPRLSTAPVEELIKYEGQHVAWNFDGKSIVMSAPDDAELSRRLIEAGIPFERVVLSYIPRADEF